jgi:hypothetical protein
MSNKVSRYYLYYDPDLYAKRTFINTRAYRWYMIIYTNTRKECVRRLGFRGVHANVGDIYNIPLRVIKMLALLEDGILPNKVKTFREYSSEFNPYFSEYLDIVLKTNGRLVI